MDLYFINETKKDLPNDRIALVKYDIVKNDTVKNYKNNIKYLKNYINNDQNGSNKTMIRDYNDIKITLQKNSKVLNQEKIQQEIQFQEIDKISNLYL